MSKHRYKWWGYVRNVLRDFPLLQEKYSALHESSVIAKYGASGGGSCGASRTTENIAIRELPLQEQREYEAVRNAIEITQNRRDGELRLKLIHLMYREGFRLTDAAYKLHISDRTALYWHGDFIRLVGYRLGLLDNI